MPDSPAKVALRTSLAYWLVAVLWILLSDRALVLLLSDQEAVNSMQTYKGWAFVTVTALLLYAVVRVQLVRWEHEAESRSRAERSLREREAQYRAVVETSTDGFWVTDMEGRILEVNDAYLRRSGYSREELLGMRITDLDAQESPEETAAHIAKIGRGGNDLFETRQRTKDGSLWQVEVNAAYWPIAGGRMFAFIRDVHQRKRSELLLRVRLQLAELARRGDVEDLMQTALDTAVLYTGSRVGVLHLVDAGQDNLTLQAWSAGGAGDARPNGPRRYPVSTAGVWAHCMRTHAAVVHNEVAGLPRGEGLPEDYAPRKRQMAVPVIRDGLVIAVICVADKPSDYAQGDVEVADALGAMMVDMVAHQRAEEQLRKFSRVVEQSAASIVITDLDGTTEYVNPKFCELTGYTREEALGANPRIVRSGLTPPEVYAGLWRTITAGGVWRGELANCKKNGEIFWEQVSISPVVDAGGRITHFVAVKQDISAVKQAEEALRASELRLRTIVDNLPALIGYVDASEHLRFVNRAYSDWYGLSEEDLLGRTVRDLIGEDGYLQVRGHIRTALERGEIVRYELALRIRGEPRQLLTTYVPDVRPDGHTHGYYVMAEDVTEFKQAEGKIRELNETLERRVAERTAELEAANRQLESFSYSVSHDLRAPLRAIAGFSDLLMEQARGELSRDHSQMLDRVAHNVQKMNALIDDLLSFSRTSRTALAPTSFDLAGLVREVSEGLEATYPSARIEIRALPRVSGDRALLRQVLVNLIGNALKFSSKVDEPRVEVGQIQRDGGTIIYVRDNGVGFDMAYGDKLFGVFQRLHRTDEFEGTGVGLAIVEQVLRRHGGRVWAEAAPGKGATFYFTLPAAS